MVEHIKPEEAISHVRDAFDDALLQCGGTDEASILLTHLLLEHAAKRTGAKESPRTPTEMRWAVYATEAMQSDDHVAVVTMVIDRTGVIRPMVSTKGLPDQAGETIRAAVTDFLCNLCSFVFKRPFRCGCSTCESKGAKELREALNAGPSWNPTKAEA